MGENVLTEEHTATAQSRAERLRFFREKVLRASRAEMKQMMAIKEATIENWEYARYSGLTERGANRIEEASKKIGIYCSAKWLLFGLGKAPSSGIAFTVPASLSSQVELSEDEIIKEELALFYRLNKNAIHFVISNNNMTPIFNSGDYVAGREYFTEDLEKALDRICIVKNLLGQLNVGMLKKGSSRGRYSLVFGNANIPAEDNIPLFSAAPILWMRRKC